MSLACSLSRRLLGAVALLTVVGLPLTAALAAGDDPVASYPLDADATDISGNGNDGTVLGAVPTADRFGTPGSAYAFDGQDDKISAPPNASLDITGAITLAAWVRPLQTKSQVLVRKGGGTTAPYALQLAGNNTIVFTLHIDGSSATITKIGYALDEWTFLTATWDGTTMRLYENGTEVSTGPRSGTLDVNASSLLIGTRLQLPADTLNGAIDQVSIWDRALSPAEITTLMQQDSTPVVSASWSGLKALFE